MKITIEMPDDTLGMSITALRDYTGMALTMTTRQVFSDELHDGAEIRLLIKEADDATD